MNQQKLPNATAALILGILSIITCWCYGIVGLILGGVGLMLANKDTKLYQQNPSLYDNYGNVKAGKILSIIGIVLGLLFLAYMVWLFSVVGMDALSNPELMQERMKDALGQ